MDVLLRWTGVTGSFFHFIFILFIRSEGYLLISSCVLAVIVLHTLLRITWVERLSFILGKKLGMLHLLNLLRMG